eukprot:2935164-Pleurochrysis_carterae.AAC.4
MGGKHIDSCAPAPTPGLSLLLLPSMLLCVWLGSVSGRELGFGTGEGARHAAYERACVNTHIWHARIRTHAPGYGHRQTNTLAIRRRSMRKHEHMRIFKTVCAFLSEDSWRETSLQRMCFASYAFTSTLNPEYN